ncbi:MAG TPA: Rrf2 family transcriptional regulator [Fimbriimonadaceae bacterium]|jgi:Rrf2 family protein
MLSNRAKYATRAILELSINFEQGPVHLNEIAERQAIPEPFLQQIMGTLRMTGFVKSRKGPGGGFMLARHPKDIMIGQLVRAIDGPIALISCVSVTRRAECGCPHPQTCGIKKAFQEARDAMAAVLDETSFEEIRKRHSPGIPLDVPDFVI